MQPRPHLSPQLTLAPCRGVLQAQQLDDAGAVLDSYRDRRGVGAFQFEPHGREGSVVRSDFPRWKGYASDFSSPKGMHSKIILSATLCATCDSVFLFFSPSPWCM